MVERPMLHCVACREEVEGDISLLSVRISVVPRSVNDRSILLDGVNYVTVGISIQ